MSRNCALTCGKCDDMVVSCRASDGKCINGCTLGWLDDQCWIPVAKTPCISEAKLNQLERLQSEESSLQGTKNIGSYVAVNDGIISSNNSLAVVARRKFGPYRGSGTTGNSISLNIFLLPWTVYKLCNLT